MLDRTFFEEEFARLGKAFAAEAGTQDSRVHITLRGGGAVRVGELVALADNWVIFRTRPERGSKTPVQQVVIPYDSITMVNFAPDDEAGRIGFTR